MEINKNDGDEIVPVEVKEEEVRAKVIADYGFDEVDDQERIDKIVAKEIEHGKKLTSAIGQKIKYRTELEIAKKATPPAPTNPSKPGDFTPELLDKRVDEKLEKRDLDSMEYPEEIKKEIQRIAQIQGVSIKQAARDPYIVSKIDAHAQTVKTEQNAISRNHKTVDPKTFTFDNIPDVDMTTKEGQAVYQAWKDEMKRQGK